MDALCKEIEETVDLEALLRIATEAATPDSGKYMELNRFQSVCREDGVRIAVAYDKAFCFYYRDNLELLEQLGAELVYFSPLKDKTLPASIGGLYLDGGYPELYAGELTGNTAMLRDIKVLLNKACRSLIKGCSSTVLSRMMNMTDLPV